VTSPFDLIAPAYAELWSSTPKGITQRAAVWREIDPLFRPGDRILDLGCGPGDDALHLAASGVSVLGVDSSPAMIAIAESRGVCAIRLAIERLDVLPGLFDGAISNFGALNCVDDLRAAARELGRLLRPAAPLAICLMSRFCWRETLVFLATFRFHQAFRRWPAQTNWRGIDVYYRTSREIRRTFADFFRFKRCVPIGGGDHHLYIFEQRPL